MEDYQVDFSALGWNDNQVNRGDNIPTGTELLDNWLTELPSHETFGCVDEGSPGAFSEILSDPFLASGDLFALLCSYDFPMEADMISAVGQSHFLVPSTLSCDQNYVPYSNDFGGVSLPGASFRDIASNTSAFSEGFSPTPEAQMSQFSPVLTASPALSWGDMLCPAPVIPVALTGETAVPPSAELFRPPAPLRPQPQPRSHHSSRQHPRMPAREIRKKERPELCFFCGKGFQYQADLKKHIRVHHPGDAQRVGVSLLTYPCPVPTCLKEYRRSDHRWRHGVNCHGWTRNTNRRSKGPPVAKAQDG